MAEYIQLPNGAYFELKEGQSAMQGLLVATRLYPEAFGTPEEKPKQDTSGFKAAASAGFERLKGETALTAGRLGLMDAQAAEQYRSEREAAARERFTPTQEGWTESPWQNFKETAGGSLPYMVAPAAAGLAALAAPASVPAAAVGLGAAGLTNFGQFVGTNLGRQMDTGKTLGQTDLTAAAAAAVPQALLDTGAMALMPGIGKLFGSVGAKLTTEEARAIATQTLSKTLADYAVKTGGAMTREGVTEATQQLFERLQAGLSITDDEARKEYIDNFIGGAALGGAGAPFGRAFERRAAVQQAEEADSADRKAALQAQTLAKQEAAKAEEERRQTPDYAKEIGAQYDALMAQQQELQAKVIKGSNLTPAQQEENKVVYAALKELKAKLREISPEYNRTKSVRDATIEQDRLKGLSDEDYMLEQSGTAQPAAPAPKMRTVIDEFGRVSEVPEVAPAAAAPLSDATQYLNAQVQAARGMGVFDIGDIADFAMQDPERAAQAVSEGVGIDGFTPQQNGALLGGIWLRLKALNKLNADKLKAEMAQRTEDMRAQKPGTESNPLARFLEDQDMLDTVRQEGLTEQEIAQLEKLAAMPRDYIEQGDLFGQPGEKLRVGQAAGVQAEETIAQKLDALQKQLDIAYAQRNVSKGGQYRETIRGLIEQIRALQDKLPLQNATNLGQETKALQPMLGELPAVEKAKLERAQALDRLAGTAAVARDGSVPGVNEEVVNQRRQDVLDALMAEIAASGRTLSPETITKVRAQADAVLASALRYNTFDQSAPLLDTLSQKWRGATQTTATESSTTAKPTPQTVTPEMLQEQLDRASARRAQFSPQTQALMERVADNFDKISNNPERIALASDWLHRATVTGSVDETLAKDLRESLDELDRGSISETETPTRETAWGTAQGATRTAQQLELPQNLMPKKVAEPTTSVVKNGKVVQEGGSAPQAPAKNSTAFATAAEFRKFLASDTVKGLRRAVGLNFDNAERMNARLEVFRRKYGNIIGNVKRQLEGLQARRDALIKQRGEATAAADKALNDAEANLKRVLTQLDSEFADLYSDYMRAVQLAEKSATEAETVARQIADNVAKFNADDKALVEGMEQIATLKAEAARITKAIADRMQSPQENADAAANIKTLVETRDKITKTISDLRKKMDRINSEGVLEFLQTSMELEVRQQLAERNLDRNGKAMLNAGLALEGARSDLHSNPPASLVKARKRLESALDVKQNVLPVIEQEMTAKLKEVDKEIAAAEKTVRSNEQELAKRERLGQPAPQEKQAAPVEGPTAMTKEASDAKKREDRETFERAMQRLNQIPGERIDFSKRRNMLDTAGTAQEKFYELDADVREAEDGIDELQQSLNAVDEELATLRPQLAKYKTRRSPKSVALANRIELLDSRATTLRNQIGILENAIKTAENKVARLQKDYEKATKLMEGGTELAEIDAKIAKALANVRKNEALAKETVGKNGRPLLQSTIDKRKQRLNKYQRDWERLNALRSNRLGITRTRVGAGAPLVERNIRASIEEQEQFDIEIARNERIEKLPAEIEALSKEYKDAVKAKDTEKAASLQGKIRTAQNELEVLKSEKARAAVRGRVSAASRNQSAAPGKLRTGSKESRAEVGKARNKVQESRKLAQPTVAQAVADANAFVASLESDTQQTPAQRKALFEQQSQETQAAIMAALQTNLDRYTREISALQEEEGRLTGIIQKGGETGPMQMRIVTVRKQLEAFKESRKRQQFALDDMNAELEATADAEFDRLGTAVEEDAPTSRSGAAIDDIYADDDIGLFRGISGPNDTPLKTQSAGRLESGDIAGAVTSIGNTTDNKVAQRVAAKIAPILEANGVKSEVVDVTTPSAPDAPGAISKDGRRVRINGATGMSEESVMHEAVHAATMFELDKPDDQLTPDQRSAKKELTKMMEEVKADPTFTNGVIKDGDIHEFVAEGNSSRAVQSYMRQRKTTDMRSMWQKFKDAVLRLLGVKTPPRGNMLDRFLDLSEKFMVARESAVVEDTSMSKFRKQSDGVATPAMDALAGKILEGNRTWRQKLGKNPLLEAEMQTADMRASVREGLKTGDTKNFLQAMYAVLKSDQKMPLVYTVLSNGPLKMYTDEKGLHGYTSSNQNSAVDLFRAVNDIPVASDRKMAVAQMYMVAQRALNKGLPRLDIGALGVTEADLKDVLSEANANPKLRASLENVRSIYNAYNKGLIDFNVQTKAISKELGDKLNKAGDYVPFYRVDGNGNASLVFDDDVIVSIGDIRRQPYLANLKGGETRLLPLDEAVFRNTTLLVDKALTNMASKEVAYALQAIGEPAKKMQIKKGDGPANPNTIRFMDQPDPNDSKDDGKRWLLVDTEGTSAEGVPTELLVKGLEGSHLPLPGFLKLAGAASDMLRSGITRMPPYILRQLIRDPMAASFTGGLNYNPLTAVFKAGKQYIASVRGNNDLSAKLIEKGLVQSGIFSGDADDISKIAKQIVGKDNMGAMDRMFTALDRYAIMADASTRALVYQNALANGLSEVEADMMTMESMNFYKRGLSPSVQYAARLIPFLNAQIQGLNVLYKAATGQMPFEEQQKIMRKFYNNAALLVAAGVVYAMAMEDDPYYKNARARDRYSNFFLPLPGVDEPVKIPVPYEAGYFFSMAVAAVDGMREEVSGKEQFQALRDMFLTSIPGYTSAFVPQIVKPVAEVWTNKNFFNGAPVESQRLQSLDVTQRYNLQTTEFAKALSKMVPILSPIQIEHIAKGYLGSMPLAIAGAANGLFAPETKGEPIEKRASDMPVIGSMFQKKFGGGDSDTVYELAGAALEARTTMNSMIKEGRIEDAKAFRQEHRAELLSVSAANSYRQLVGRINVDLRRLQERDDLTSEEKAARREKLESAKQDAATRFLQIAKRAEEAGTTRQ